MWDNQWKFDLGKLGNVLKENWVKGEIFIGQIKSHNNHRYDIIKKLHDIMDSLHQNNTKDNVKKIEGTIPK